MVNEVGDVMPDDSYGPTRDEGVNQTLNHRFREHLGEYPTSGLGTEGGGTW